MKISVGVGTKFLLFCGLLLMFGETLFGEHVRYEYVLVGKTYLNTFLCIVLNLQVYNR
jgi:hypothetical protein